ncbi:MAG: SRPBCC domain-containing protein [Acidobacteriaceae bacterium]
MPTNTAEQTIQTLEIMKDEEIAAPIDVVFETILEQMGPLNETSDGKSLSMKLEPWPGGRWFRDLGDNAGHFWGHVQAIKPPTLLEICGPLFMSNPAISNVQYRLTEENGITRMKFVHRAIGLIPAELLDGVNVNKGWNSILTRIREVAERHNAGLRGKK